MAGRSAGAGECVQRCLSVTAAGARNLGLDFASIWAADGSEVGRVGLGTFLFMTVSQCHYTTVHVSDETGRTTYPTASRRQAGGREATATWETARSEKRKADFGKNMLIAVE